jgi:hypothetical protein
MKKVVDESMFHGAVSVEQGDGWLRPWRLPFDRLDLFVAPEDSLANRACHSSGVRLRFETDSTRVGIEVQPMASEPGEPANRLDLTIDGELIDSLEVADRSTCVTFDGLKHGAKIVDVWLPQGGPIKVTGIVLDDDASCRTAEDSNPKWVTYGSSLTHCCAAHSPARTWPAIVARRKGFNLTSLGYGGNCCLEPMVAMMIRDLPADFISLKLGINCIGGALSPRTFAAAVTGLVQIIREKKPSTPIALISPIGYPPNETEPNVVGHTIEQMRHDIRDVHARLVARGDGNLHHFNGLDVFNLDEIARYAEDQCHPDGDGIEVMAENFIQRVIAKMPLPHPP